MFRDQLHAAISRCKLNMHWTALELGFVLCPNPGLIRRALLHGSATPREVGLLLLYLPQFRVRYDHLPCFVIRHEAHLGLPPIHDVQIVGE